MANRNRYYERGGEGRRDYGDRAYGDRGGYNSDYDRERGRSSGYSGYYPDYDRGENYFGGGNMQYGQGYTGGGYDRDFGSINPDYDRSYSRSDRGYSSNYGRDYDRENYGGYDRQSSLNEYGGGGTYGGYRNRADYGRGSGSRYSERNDYLDSERGYDREDRGWLDRASDEVSSWFGDDDAERRRRRDYRRQGEHRGRGPRNYTRSDDRIREDINDRLTDHSYLDASDIEVEVNNGEVILKGTVDTRYAKRQAEDIAEDVSGVSHLENRIRVNNSSFSTENNTATVAGTSETSNTTIGKSRGKTA